MTQEDTIANIESIIRNRKSILCEIECRDKFLAYINSGDYPPLAKQGYLLYFREESKPVIVQLIKDELDTFKEQLKEIDLKLQSIYTLMK